MINQINSRVRNPTPMFRPLNQRDHSKGDRRERRDDIETAWVVMVEIFRYRESSNLTPIGSPSLNAGRPGSRQVAVASVSEVC